MTIFVLFARHDPPGGAPGGNELAYQLRGGPLWAIGGDVRAPATDGSVPRPRGRRKRDVAFANLPFLMDNPQILDSLVELGMPLIIDVHFPFGAPDQVLAIQPAVTDETRDQALDDAAIDHWSRPETINRALNVLVAATVITSPREDWAALIDGRSTPVMVLPDIVDVRSGARFFRRFARIGVIACGGNWIDSVGASLAGRVLSRRVRNRLAELDIDWAARRAGVE